MYFIPLNESRLVLLSLTPNSTSHLFTSLYTVLPPDITLSLSDLYFNVLSDWSRAVVQGQTYLFQYSWLWCLWNTPSSDYFSFMWYCCSWHFTKQCSGSQFSALIPLKSFGIKGCSLQNILNQAEMSQSDATHHLLYSVPCYAQAGSATQTFKCFTILLLLGAALYYSNQNLRSK